MMENHSFDNIIGMLGCGDGLTLGRDGFPIETQPGLNGTIQKMFPMPNTCQLSSSPGQERTISHSAFNNGSMDGFVTGGSGPVAAGYFNSTHLLFTYSLFSHFPIADRFFCSLLGQTWPNRMYLIAATSRGIVDTSEPDAGIYCPAGTICNAFDKYNISWRDYTDDADPTYNTPDLLPTNDNVTTAAHLRTTADFFADAAAELSPHTPSSTNAAPGPQRRTRKTSSSAKPSFQKLSKRSAPRQPGKTLFS